MSIFGDTSPARPGRNPGTPANSQSAASSNNTIEFKVLPGRLRSAINAALKEHHVQSMQIAASSSSTSTSAMSCEEAWEAFSAALRTPLNSQYTEQYFAQLYNEYHMCLVSANANDTKTGTSINEFSRHLQTMHRIAMTLNDEVPSIVIAGLIKYVTAAVETSTDAEKRDSISHTAKDGKLPQQPKITWHHGKDSKQPSSTHEYKMELDLWLSNHHPSATSMQKIQFILTGFGDSPFQIRQMVSDILSKCNTPEQAWNQVHAAFGATNEHHRSQRMRDFLAMEIQPHENIRQFLYRYELQYNYIFLDPPTAIEQSFFVMHLVTLLQQGRRALYEQVVKLTQSGKVEPVPLVSLKFREFTDVILLADKQLMGIIANQYAGDKNNQSQQQGQRNGNGMGRGAGNNRNNTPQRSGNNDNRSSIPNNRNSNPNQSKHPSKHSEAGDATANNESKNNANNQQSKNKAQSGMCRDFTGGNCHRGDTCRFSHSTVNAKNSGGQKRKAADTSE